jgi:ribulose-phosphate 3-epimerase
MYCDMYFVEDPLSLINAVKAKGMKVGIAIKPKTPASSVFEFGDKVDMLLVMTVGKAFLKFLHKVNLVK